jgi:hypothetical protein
MRSTIFRNRSFVHPREMSGAVGSRKTTPWRNHDCEQDEDGEHDEHRYSTAAGERSRLAIAVSSGRLLRVGLVAVRIAVTLLLRRRHCALGTGWRGATLILPPGKCGALHVGVRSSRCHFRTVDPRRTPGTDTIAPEHTAGTRPGGAGPLPAMERERECSDLEGQFARTQRLAAVSRLPQCQVHLRVPCRESAGPTPSRSPGVPRAPHDQLGHAPDLSTPVRHHWLQRHTARPE